MKKNAVIQQTLLAGGLMVFVFLFSAFSAEAGPYELKPVDDDAFIKTSVKKLNVESVELQTINGHRVGRVPNGDHILLTGDYATPVGYRGPTSVMLLMDESLETVKQAVLIESCDSPPYVQRALKKGMIRSLNGTTVVNGEVTVDAVSGATRTCDAVQQAVNETIKQFKNK